MVLHSGPVPARHSVCPTPGTVMGTKTVRMAATRMDVSGPGNKKGRRLMTQKGTSESAFGWKNTDRQTMMVPVPLTYCFRILKVL